MISLILALFCLQDPAQAGKIPLAEGIRHSPTLSPDGAWIYFFQSLEKKPDNFRKYARNEALFRTHPDGKNIEKILEIGDTRGRLHWAEDGKRIVVTRRIADTNGDGEVGFGDGMSLTSADPDGKNSKDLRAPGPELITVYSITPAGEFILGLRLEYRKDTPKIVRFLAGKEDTLIAEGWAYYPLNQKSGMIRIMDPNRNDFLDPGTLHHLNLETGKTSAFSVTGVIRGPIPTPKGLAFAQIQSAEKGENNSPVSKNKTLNSSVVIIQSNRDGTDPAPLTNADSIWIPLYTLKTGLLLHRTRGKETEFGILSGEKEWKTLWKAPENNQVGFPWLAPDKTTILFAVLRDGNGDGKLVPGEDPSDIHLLRLK